jgi:mono/diheme cytochrome c family protein
VRRAAIFAAVSALVATGLTACGAGKEVLPRPETVIGTIAAQTLPKGDPAAGKPIFNQQGCNGCHTLADAGAKGTTGPNLDQALKGKDEQFIRESIVNPNAEIASGYQPNIMPSNYGQQLSQAQLADLVAYLAKSTS